MTLFPESHPEPQPNRRSWLETLAVSLGAVATLALTIPVVGYVLGLFFRPKRLREDAWVRLDYPLAHFPENDTRLVTYKNPPAHTQPWDGKSADAAAYVRCLSQGKDYMVFAVNCTHLGCPVSWFPQSGLFMCPCHGGVYYEDGTHASGPPPRRLYRYDWRIEDDYLWIKAGHLPTLQNPLDPKDRA